MRADARFVVVAERPGVEVEEGRFSSYGEAFTAAVGLLPGLAGGFVRIVERGLGGDHVRVVMR